MIMEQELKTRFDTNKRLREKYERMLVAKKYMIVFPSGDVRVFLSKAAATRIVDRDGCGVIVSFVDFDKLPEGINAYQVEALNEDGEWYPLMSTMWTAKTLSYWWGTDGKGDLFPWEWKGKKLRFFANGEPAELVYEWGKKFNFEFPVDAESGVNEIDVVKKPETSKLGAAASRRPKKVA